MTTPDAVRVTCAVIVRDGKVLATRRGPGMDRSGLWEFPGGKVRDGEGDAACLVREIEEELALQVHPVRRLEANAHRYPDGVHIVLVPFLCRLTAGVLSPAEHSACRWCDREALAALDWCPADAPVVQRVVREWDELTALDGPA